MEAVIERSHNDTPSGVAISVVHRLPGRLRLHLSNGSEDEREYLEQIIARARGVRSVRANSLTGNVLIHYDTASTDEPAVLDVVRNALIVAGRTARIESDAAVSGRGGYHAVSPVTGRPAPDPSRIVMPVLHLVYSATPVGVAMHLGELAWALKRRLHPGHVAVPVLHLVFAYSTVGIVIHAGELIWALAPFTRPAAPARRR
jgi:hypothetical protein